MKIGFVGLGAMGSVIAPRLLEGGNELIVYNRTKAKARALVDAGARVTDTLAGLGECEVVISMLSDDDAVAKVVAGPGGLVEAMGSGAVHVCMATISPRMAERIAMAHSEKDQVMLSAPVLGRPPAAAAGQLVIMPAGDSATIERLRPLFGLMGSKIIPMGAKPSMANIAKISVNFLVAAAIEGMSESFALVRKAGIDPESFLEILTSTIFNAPAYNVYAPMVAREIHKPAAFTMPLGLKDVRLALSAGEELGVPLPFGGILQSQMISAIARGYGESDWAALGVIAARNAGIKEGAG